MTKEMKGVVNIFKSIGVILFFLLFPSLLFIIFNINPNKVSNNVYVMYLTLANFILFLIFVLIYRKTLIRDGKKFLKNFSSNFELSFKYWLTGFAIMIVSNLFISFILKKSIAGNEDLVRSFINISPLLMIFDTVIFAPVLEELTFRKNIRDAINNKWLFVLLSGIIFGFLHIFGYITSLSDLIYLVPYSALGISFALLYYRTDNIFSTISMHAMHNLLAVLVYLLGVLL